MNADSGVSLGGIDQYANLLQYRKLLFVGRFLRRRPAVVVRDGGSSGAYASYGPLLHMATMQGGVFGAVADSAAVIAALEA